MTVFYFVRHAEPNYSNHNDALRELSPKGMEDRKLVTAYLADKNIDIVLSSPFKRSIDTVRDFADKYQFHIEIVEDFRERKIDNVWIEDFNAFCRKQWEDFSYKLSDGESLQEVQSRNINALKAVLNKYPDKNIAVGSHGTALSAIINYFEPSFGYQDYEKIKLLTPWIVKLSFQKDSLQDMEMINLFTPPFSDRQHLL